MAERWRHVSGCGRFFNCLARHRERQDPRRLQGRRAEARTRRRRGCAHDPGLPRRRRRDRSTARAPFPSPSTASLTAATRAIRSPPPCSPTACASSAAPTNITARAASSAAGAEEPNALVGVSRGPGRFTPNLRATQVELYDGLVATSQNRWPSLSFDVGAINDVALAALSAPASTTRPSWARICSARTGPGRRVYEPAIRRAAGLGTAPTRAGPGPLRALFRSLRRADRRRRPGGARGGAGGERERARRRRLRREPGIRRLAPRRDQRADRRQNASANGWPTTLAALRSAPNVRLMPRTQAFGYYAQNFVALSERLAEPDLIANPDLAARAAVADAGA